MTLGEIVFRLQSLSKDHLGDENNMFALPSRLRWQYHPFDSQ